MGENTLKNKLLWPKLDVENRVKESFLGCG
jgi:hypothetical protein